jgi:hypothetical protein
MFGPRKIWQPCKQAAFQGEKSRSLGKFLIECPNASSLHRFGKTEKIIFNFIRVKNVQTKIMTAIVAILLCKRCKFTGWHYFFN